MRGGIDQATRKRRSKQVAKCVALLQQTGDNTAGLGGTVLECRGGGVPVETAHRNPEQGAAGQELLVGLAEARAQFEDDEQDQIDNKRPFAAITIGRNTEDDRADGPQHEHEGDAPGDISDRRFEARCQIFRCKRDQKKSMASIVQPRKAT